MLIYLLWLLNFSLLCSEGWAWDHVSRDVLETRLAGEAPVLVACKLVSLVYVEGT